jgi:hypothetical protein
MRVGAAADAFQSRFSILEALPSIGERLLAGI